MTPEEIINENIGHPDWQNIKLSNPDEYQRLSRNAILCKFGIVLPFYLKWQRKLGIFDNYIKSLPSVSEALNSINLEEYEKGINEKKRLTSKFFSKCISYGVDEINNVISYYDEYKSLKIKNLINRSFQQYYSYRRKVINNIEKLLNFEEDEINRIEILAYIPFQNYFIGIDWMQRHLKPTMSELLDDWLILLSVDTDMFTSDKFITELKISLGEETTIRLQKKLFIHIAKSETENKILNKIKQKYNRHITRYINLLTQGEIVEDVKFGDIYFDKRNVCFYKFRMPIYPYLNQSEISYLKKIIDPSRLLTIFVSTTPTKGIHTFRPIFAEDMEYLMMTIKKARIEAPISYNKIEKELIPSKKHVGDTVKKEACVNKIQFTPHLNILATNVQAFQFKIKKGVIEYKTDEKVYYFRSVKIPNKVSEIVLDKIEHYFTLVKDKSVIVNNRTELRFYFEPANDLSFLLAEIERLSCNHNALTDISFPQSGEFEIPWRYVRFYEGVLMIFHPNPSKKGTLTPYYFRNSDILKSFEDIRPYIESRCSKLRIRAVDGVITKLLNYEEFRSGIAQHKDWEKEENIGFGRPIKANKNYSFSKESFITNANVRKSPYLSYLASIQHNDLKIIYVLERVIHESGLVDQDEYGYIFVIKKDLHSMVLLYENITDSSRSSILFYIHPDYYQQAIETIRKFFASDIKNKRQKLSYGQIRFKVPYIIDFKRIKHSNIIDWKYTLNDYL